MKFYFIKLCSVWEILASLQWRIYFVIEKSQLIFVVIYEKHGYSLFVLFFQKTLLVLCYSRDGMFDRVVI